MSGRSAAININLPTIVRYRLCSAGPSRGFSSGTLDSDRTPGECTGLQFSEPAQDNRLSKSFARDLTKKSPFRLDQQSPEEFCLRLQLWTTRFQQQDLAHGSQSPVQSFIGKTSFEFHFVKFILKINFSNSFFDMCVSKYFFKKNIKPPPKKR